MKRQLCTGLLALGFCGNAAAQDVLAPLPQALTDTADIATLSGLSNGPALAAVTAPTDVLPSLPSEDLESVVGFLENLPETLPGYLESVPDIVEFSLDTLPELPLYLVDDVVGFTVPELLEATPEDLNIIVGNLENVPAAAIDGREIRSIDGYPVTSETGLRDAAVELLGGNLVASSPYDVDPSATTSTLFGLAAATDTLVANTSYDRDYAGGYYSLLNVPVFGLSSKLDVSNTILYGTFLTYSLAAEELEPVEEDMHPLFEGAEPLALPVIDILEDL